MLPWGGNSDEVGGVLHVAVSIPCMRERVLVRALVEVVLQVVLLLR